MVVSGELAFSTTSCSGVHRRPCSLSQLGGSLLPLNPGETHDSITARRFTLCFFFLVFYDLLSAYTPYLDCSPLGGMAYLIKEAGNCCRGRNPTPAAPCRVCRQRTTQADREWREWREWPVCWSNPTGGLSWSLRTHRPCRAACHDKLTWAQRGPGRTNAVLMGSAGRKAAFCS